MRATPPPLPQASELARDAVFADRYRIIRPLADGGMGKVYLGKQLELDRLVAIKTIQKRHHGSRELILRLRREAKVIERLTHPNTVRIYDFGQTKKGLVYLVMEYLRGQTLDKILKRTGPFPPDVVCDIGRQVLKSLVEAHSIGVIHRDVKPSNVILCDQVGEANFVKVLDFGLAALRDESSPLATLTGMPLGTPSYMSPEQVRGQKADARSDLYSLGLTLFELATGQRAYDGGTAYQVAMRHITADRLAIPKGLVGTPLGGVILRAVEKSPADRYQTARDMLYALAGDSDVASLFLDESPPPQDSGPPLGPDTLEALQTLDSADFTVVDDFTEQRRPGFRWTALAAVGLSLLGWGLVSPASPSRPTARDLSEVVALNASPVMAHPVATGGTARDPSGPAPAQGDLGGAVLLVTTSPNGALVLLNGRPVCHTPCREESKPGLGARHLIVTLDGYEPCALTVDLSRDVALPLVLTPRPATPSASEVVTTATDVGSR